MRKLILILFMTIGTFHTVHAQDLAVDEIVQKANTAAYYSGQDGLSDIKMTIIDSQGRERVREFRIMPGATTFDQR